MGRQRRGWLRLLGLITTAGTITVLATGSVFAAGDPSEWRQPDYNAAHSRANTQETILNPSNVTLLTFDLAVALAPPHVENCNRGDVTTPAVTTSRLFTVYGPDLASFNTTSGARLWRVPLPFTDEPPTGVAVRAGRVFVGRLGCGSTSDPCMSVMAFDAASGARLWLDGCFPAGNGTFVAAGAQVVVSGETLGSGRTVDVLDAATGARLWQTLDDLSCEARAPALVADQAVILGHCDESGAAALQARALASGALRWRKPGGWHAERGESEAAGGRFLLAVDPTGKLAALDARTGAVLWSTAASNHSLAVDTQRAYATCGTELCALSRATGAVLWHRAPPSGTIAIANGVVYASGGEVLSAADGHTLGTLWSDGHTLTGIVNGRVVALDASHRTFDFYALPAS